MKTAKIPSTDELIKKVWCLCTMELYSATKKNEILLFASKWMELESFILSEVSQFQKAKIIFSTYHRKYVEYKYKKYYEKQVKLRGSHI
jgi:hypothetical protein